MKKSDMTTAAMMVAGLGALLAARSVARKSAEIDLRGKVVLVTGGSRGLGLTMSRMLAAEGAKVVICARDEEELRRAAMDIRRRGGQVYPFTCDVTKRAQVDVMMQEIRQRVGPIDVLINNAGVIQVGPLETMRLEDFELAMNTHFWAPLYTVCAVLPEMRRRREGRIVNIASIGGKVSVPHLLPYDASKFALVGLSEGLRAELLKDGIKVTTVCPGLMRTGGHFNADFKSKHEEEYAWFNLGGATSVTSMNVERAARAIIRAMKRGENEVILTIQANMLAKFHGVAPGLTSDAMGVVNTMLPKAGGIGERTRKGKHSQGKTPKALTALNDKQAYNNNEV